jgi:hypothetical protein
MSITTRAVLFELNISQFTGRKIDRKTADEVTKGKSATRNAASVAKYLFADVKELDEINKFTAMVRKEFYIRTLPWSDSGQRLVPMDMFFSLTEWFNGQEVEFNRLVEAFVDKYTTLISAQAFKLGALFDRSEYPDATSIRSKFRFNLVCSPVPEAGDFRVDVEETIAKALAEKYESIYAERTAKATQDLWDRLYEQLRFISDKLSPNEDGTNKIFRDSMVSNAMDLCALLKDLNVLKDPELEKARKALEDTLLGVTPDELRKQNAIKHDVKAQIDSVLSSYGW